MSNGLRTRRYGPGFNVKIVVVLRETGSVSSGNLSTFDVIRSKAREIVSDWKGEELPVTTP